MIAASPTAKLDPDRIDAIFAGIDCCHLPGVAVAVAIGGVPVYRKGFGLANMELPVTLGPSMRMRIGSTTKHFSTLAYLLLCEDGLATLDDEVGRHLPELNATNGRVTMRQLMGHTSGLRDIYAVTMFFHGTGISISEQDMLAYYGTIDDVDFEPGAHWSYNNGGYMLLGLAIERIAGAPLAEVLRRRIFEPVGMHDTLLRRWDSDFVPNSATLHTLDRQGRYARDYMGMEIGAAGGMASTMDDMLRWLKHMDAPIVGSAETWELMRQPHRLTNGFSTGYGLGLIRGRYRGVDTLGHGGTVLGGNSQMIKLPSAGLDISLAVNRADLSSVELGGRIIDACVQGLEPLSEAPHGGPHQGVFVCRRDGRVAELVATDGRQFVEIDGMPGVPMTADAHGVLQLPPEVAVLKRRITVGEKTIRLSEFGQEDEFEAIERKPDAAPGELLGDFANEGIAVRLTITEGSDKPRLATSGRHGGAQFDLEPVGERIWKAVPLGLLAWLQFILTLDADGKGLTIRADRMADVHFRRVNFRENPPTPA